MSLWIIVIRELELASLAQLVVCVGYTRGVQKVLQLNMMHK